MGPQGEPNGWLAEYLRKINGDVEEIRKEQAEQGKALAALTAAREESLNAAVSEARRVASEQSSASRRQQMTVGGGAGGVLWVVFELAQRLIGGGPG